MFLKSLIISFSLVAFANSNVTATNSGVKALPDAFMFAKKGRSLNRGLPNGVSVVRPYAEYENVRYVMFSMLTAYEESEIKRTVLKNMPSDVDVIFIINDRSSSSVSVIKDYYSDVIEPTRVHVVRAGGYSTGVRWTRDHAPIPVYINDKGEEKLAFVDADYYNNFEADFEIGNFLGVPILSHGYQFEGGNFLADNDGRCFVMKNRRIRMTKETFEKYYGCAKTIFFPDRGKVGHIDERVKIVRDGVALTDDEEYADILRREGYQVTTLPKARGYRTYANSLLINNVVILPIFGSRNDQVAIDIYKGLGLEVHPVRAEKMSDKMLGNAHCISMLYPITPLHPAQ